VGVRKPHLHHSTLVYKERKVVVGQLATKQSTFRVHTLRKKDPVEHHHSTHVNCAGGGEGTRGGQ